MDELVLYIVLGIVAVLASAALIWFRQKGYIDLIKNFYEKYKVIIDAYGEYIRKRDPELYEDLISCGEAFENAIADDEITREELISIYKEAKEIFDRCQEIIHKEEM